jgi:RimJ/RimL family protein N-acetyltransferase
MTIIIETERLILRTWKKEDIEPYYQINQDLKVIEYLRGPLTMNQVSDFIKTTNSHNDKYGYALWAVQLKETSELIGFIGLQFTDWESHFTPAVEVGWRLGSQYWKKGYATEGARAALEYGFNRCGLKEIISFTVPANVRSISVMEKIGLKQDMNGNFAHPKLEPNHRLSQHVLYRITKEDYK